MDTNKVCMAEVLAGETMITLGTRDDDKSLLYGSAKLKGRKVQFDSEGLSPFRRTFTVRFPKTFRSPFCKRGGLVEFERSVCYSVYRQT
ncbi:hypothetical protein HanPI659440_Chr17g0682251 [Helianthus annuus]|nr:hypothetical protein HanPI659440_Chr17g0682251 [Helianthus annuus]